MTHKLINLTGKAIKVRLQSGSTATLPSILPPAQLVPVDPEESHADGVPFPVVLSQRYRIEGLPDFHPDGLTNYVVTQDVALASPERWDLLTPLPPNDKGIHPGFVAWDNSDIVSLAEKETP